MDFVTIDFEIANNELNSACSIGLASVIGNEIVDKRYFTIKPPDSYMDPEMTKIHGLTIDDVNNSPTFDEVWGDISHFFNESTYIIAHNAQFDMSVLKNCLLAYEINSPDFNYICSIPISTRACRGEGVPNSLAARTKRFDIVMDNHHNALSDAIACAELVLASMVTKNRMSIHTYLSTFYSIPVKRFADLKYRSSFRKRNRFENIRIKDIVPQQSEFQENHPLFEKAIVFTGSLKDISRKDAMQKVVDLGAVIRSAVNKNTDYLVVGKQDKNVVGKTGRSSKERRADELIEQGIEIKIIHEDDFIYLVRSGLHVVK